MVGENKVLVVATLAVIGVMVFVVPANAGTMLTTSLTGAAEVDGAGNPNQGDPDGTGTARLNLMPKKENVCYSIAVENIEPATMAHIHKAPAGQNGPIFKGLMAPSDGSSSGCAKMKRKQIMMIKNNPQNFYVNVHNVPFPNGALRGQLG